jgi:hypothetical protein
VREGKSLRTLRKKMGSVSVVHRRMEVVRLLIWLKLIAPAL